MADLFKGLVLVAGVVALAAVAITVTWRLAGIAVDAAWRWIRVKRDARTRDSEGSPERPSTPSNCPQVTAPQSGPPAGMPRHSFRDNPVSFAAEVAKATRAGHMVYIDASKASPADMQAFLDALEVATEQDAERPSVIINPHE